MQKNAKKPPRDATGNRTGVPTHGGGRRAVQWRKGVVLGTRGGFRGRAVATRSGSTGLKVKRACRICGWTHKSVIHHELHCVAKWSCVLRDRQSLCLVSGAPPNVLKALDTCIGCGQRVRALVAAAALIQVGYLFRSLFMLPCSRACCAHVLNFTQVDRLDFPTEHVCSLWRVFSAQRVHSAK